MPINVVETKDVRYVQNITGGQLTLPDLGDKGCYLDTDEVLDLNKFFTREQIQKSQALARGINRKMIQVLSEKDYKDMDACKIVRTKKKYESYPTTSETPVVDKDQNVFDEKLKELREKEKEEEKETRASER